ncbi:MAG: hypothetical protein ACREJX_19170 [Polyangiaceae bacterium]
MSNRFHYARWVAAAFLGVSAIRHVVLAIQGDPSVARHWLFVAVNFGLALLLVRWPRPALYATLLLSVQQEYSHGSALLESMRGPGPFDFASLAVCIFFPALLVLLTLERRQ